MFNIRLSKSRKAKGYTQQQMAEKLDTGLRQYQRYESGDSQPTIDGLVEISVILGVSTDYLLCLDEG